MVELIRKFESHGIKITRVKSILYQIYQFTWILHGLGVSCDRGRFSVPCPFMNQFMLIGINIQVKIA